MKDEIVRNRVVISAIGDVLKDKFVLVFNEAFSPWQIREDEAHLG